jgi:hypothetical protein
MWAVVVFHVALWGPVTELGYLAKTDDFAHCSWPNAIAIQANELVDFDREHFIVCKRIDE